MSATTTTDHSQKLFPTLYAGSVKNVRGPIQINGPKQENIESLLFQFTDAFSVFDYGRMPDEIPLKGQCLSVMSAYFFEKLSDPSVWREFSASDEARELRKSAAQIGKDTSLAGKTLAQDPDESFAVHFNEWGERLQKEAIQTHSLK